MPETAILNDKNTWDDAIQDGICPDYGFTRKRPNTRVGVKAPGGQPFTRETQNAGYSFSLSWINRSYKCVQRIKQFAEQYEDGFFTIIDRDGGGRHYVGRFVGEVNDVRNGFDNWSISGLTFEEVPGAPMLQYPHDWQRDSVALRPYNDFGTQLASTVGTWAKGVADDSSVTLESAGTLNDAAVMEYRGYGFQLWMRQGPAYGRAEISLDGTVLGSVDLYNAAAMGQQMVFERVRASTDLHRVKVRALGTQNAASTAAALSFCRLQVMR